MRLSELMQTQIVDTFPEESLADAAARMRDHGIGSLPVIDGETLVGIVTDRDLMRAVPDGSPAHVTPVATYMSRVPVVAGPDDDSVTAAQLMVRNDVRHLSIVEGTRLVGIVSARDLLVLEGWPLPTASR